jgi:hypothetical protein
MRIIAIAAVSLLATAAIAAEEPVVVDAFAMLTARGAVIASSDTATSFAGDMHGPYFVDTGHGPVPARRIVCVGTIEADSANGRQTGAARCRIEAEDGAVAYGGFTCEGWRLVGCAGPFTMEGGAGRLAGLRAEGPIVLRRYETMLTPAADGALVEQALGIASWKGLTLHSATQP